MFDAVYVPGGEASVKAIAAEANAVHFLNEAFKHCKAIAADQGAKTVLDATYFGTARQPGLVIGGDAKKLATEFIAAIAQHRVWEREPSRKVPA
ncbi:hydroperoxidase II [compost metagenome]